MSTLKTSNFQSLTAGTPPVFKDLNGTEIGQLCRAWVNFNGTTASPSTIRGSFNVSSVTKNGTGDYTVNFTTALADTNYAPTFGGFNTGNGDGGWIAAGNGSGAYPTGVTTTSLRLLTFNNAGASQDQQAVFVHVFR